ncbi:MAG: multiheme c-type cytochrome, partial [Planctomycetota bacterium]
EVILLVAHAPDPVTRAIAHAVPGIQLAIHTHPEVESHATTSFEHGSAFAVAFPGGGLPLRMRLRYVPGATSVTDEDDVFENRTWLGRVRDQLASQIREREKATGERARELDEQIAVVTAKLREREAKLPKELNHEVMIAAIPLMAHVWRPNQDPEVVAAIERFKTDVDKLGLDPEVAKKIEAPGVTAKGRPDAFAGAATCVTCHKLQAESWRKTQHSNAWQTLVKSESQKDPSCVGCHSIGFRKPGGFAEPRRVEHDGRDYRNVQCESCHGARHSHTEDPRGAGVGIRLPTIADCQKCHDSEHDPTFDATRFEKAIKGKICVKGLP